MDYAGKVSLMGHPLLTLRPQGEGVKDCVTTILKSVTMGEGGGKNCLNLCDAIYGRPHTAWTDLSGIYHNILP